MILGRFFPIAILLGSFAATGVGFVAGAAMGLVFGIAGIGDPLSTPFLAGILLPVACGAFVGGRLTAGHAPGDETFNAAATGLLLFVGGFIDLGATVLPLWFKLASGLVSLTFVLLGSRFYLRRFATA